MAVNDQFEHARIPLRPLAYANRHLAQPDELIVDFGKTGDESYHIYIADTNDPTKLYDITEMIIKHMLPTAKINVDQFEVSLEGVKDTVLIKDIMNYIYKRFIYPENYGIFDYNKDKYKLFDDSALSTLIRDAEGRVILPITFADNVYFKNGKTIQDQYNEITRLGISRDRVIGRDDTQEYVFTYPFENYMDDVEIRLNSDYLTDQDYSITPIFNNGKYVTGKINFINPTIKAGDKIDLIFTYNALAYRNSNYEYMDGKNIAMRSIPTSRLSRISDEYTLMDDQSLATSKALFNLYRDVSDLIELKLDNFNWSIDSSEDDDVIHVNSDKQYITNCDTFIAYVYIANRKKFNTYARIEYKHGELTNVPIVDACLKDITRGYPRGKVVKLMWDKASRRCILMNADISNLRTAKWVHKCLESETKICYCGMDYDISATITVYKNGIRLFEDIDYSIDRREETVTLFNPTEEGDTVVFEALFL